MTEARKVAVILVADVVGYSRLAGADEERTIARLRALRSDLIDPTIALHNGRLVKRTGDGAVVEFRSVVEAVRAAIEVQTGLAERNAGVPAEKRIEARVGIHLGDVVEEADGDLMGDAVNVAARLESICEPGGVCLSEDAYRQVRDKLQVTFADLGEQSLKNIARPVRAYAVKLGAPMSASVVGRKARNKALVWSAAAAALVAVLIAAGRFGWREFAPPPAPAPAPVASVANETLAHAPHLSIVVLPFANLSADPAQDYLADALTDQLTTALTRIPESFVIARNTAYTFKGRPVDAKAIGKDLGVRFVLEGSVQPSGDRVRVNAQLIDADSGAHLWADQFDASRGDVLQMQDEIVARLAHALELKGVELAAARLKRTPAANPAVGDLVLQCSETVLKKGYVGKEADAGYRLCEQALAADPNNAVALAVLSIKFWLPVALGRSADPKGDLRRSDELVSRALALDPNLPVAHAVKANLLRIQGRLDEAIAESERALALDPSWVGSYGDIGGAYTQLGQFEKGLESSDKAIRLSPHDPVLIYWYEDKSSDYIGLGQYDQAIEWARRAIALDPADWGAHTNLIAALALTGRQVEAQEALRHYLTLSSGGPKTITALTASSALSDNLSGDPGLIDFFKRRTEGLRQAGMPER